MDEWIRQDRGKGGQGRAGLVSMFFVGQVTYTCTVAACCIWEGEEAVTWLVSNLGILIVVIHLIAR